MNSKKEHKWLKKRMEKNKNKTKNKTKQNHFACPNFF